jgi:hypothetical protein
MLIALLTWTLLQTPAVPPAGEAPCKIVVLNLRGKGLPESAKDLPAVLSETVANEVSAASKCQVVSQSDITQMLDFEADKASCDDSGESCLREIGGALGADRIVGGTLGMIGNDFVFNARLINVKQGIVEQRAEVVSKNNTDDLRLGATNCARRLFSLADVSSVATGKVDSSSAGVLPIALLGGGVVVAVVGGVMIGYAELDLRDAKSATKDTSRTIGFVGVGVAAVGVAAAAVGGALLATSGGE